MTEELPLARRDAIAVRLAHGQPVIAAALATEFGVSEDAIRRDLRALAAEGRCRRVYGGALPSLPESMPLVMRIGDGGDSGKLLAQAAARLIQPHEFIFLDSSNANLILATTLPENYDLTVATNSVDIAAVVLRRHDLRLIMVGGAVNPLVGGCVDIGAIMSIEQMNLDRCFLGLSALSPTEGLSTSDSSDATFKRALLNSSRHSVCLVPKEKIEARAPYRVVAVNKIGALVVDADAPAAWLEKLAQVGATVHKAEASAWT